MLAKITASSFRYDIWRLVNRKMFASPEELQHPFQIISDIDKTYLETTYDSLRSMAKIALEDASDKKTVEGAREFLRALKWHSPFVHQGCSPPLHFVSSSPPQLRGVLEHKIGKDLLVCASNSFKDQFYNLKKGKLSLLKRQISYKLASLLSLISTFQNTEKLLLIGDNAESDPLVYAWIQKILYSSLSDSERLACLEALEVPREVAQSILEAMPQQRKNITVQVAIRRVKSRPNTVETQAPGTSIHWFSHYTELALICYELGWLSASGWNAFAREYYQSSDVDPTRLIALFLSLHPKKPELSCGPFMEKLLQKYPNTSDPAPLPLTTQNFTPPSTHLTPTAFQNWAQSYLAQNPLN